jgi:mannose-6-phosphate isomerase-like protein (cupin superfamily)
MNGLTWQTRRIGPTYDLLAPDGSEIRLLVSTSRASMVHCALPPGHVTHAVRHRSVEEVWYCIAGRGEAWRRSSDGEETIGLDPGVALTIPLGTELQFRATGNQRLELVIATMPPWPGAHEAEPVAGVWEPTV